MNVYLIFIIFVGATIFFILLAIGYRILINRFLGRHIERYAKGGFLSDIEIKENKNGKNQL